MMSRSLSSSSARLVAAMPNRVRLARYKSTEIDLTDELVLLERLLKETKRRKAEEAKAAAAAAAAERSGNKFQIQTFNSISKEGLKRFPPSSFVLTGSSGTLPAGVKEEAHAILLRSHKLKNEEVGHSVRAIARCGAGTNNVPIEEMTKRGIPVRDNSSHRVPPHPKPLLMALTLVVITSLSFPSSLKRGR